MAGLTKIVFVGNLPYSHSDDLQKQLEQVFATVGPVSNFRIAFEKETGKPRGFGFCEYFDTQTADSAIRNLQGIEIGGRALRLDFADVGNHDTRDAGGRPPPVKGRRSGGGGQSGGGGNMSNEPNGSSARNSGPITTGLPPDLPRGQPLAAGQSATDQISQTLAAIPPAQLAEITGQMKQLVASAPDQARQLLNANPQLTYALFQAMLMMGVVDASILTRMLAPAAMQKQQQQQQPIPQAAMPSHQMPVGFGANAYAQQPMRPGGMTQQPSYSTPLAPLPNYGITPQQAAPQPVQPAPVIPQQQQQQQPQVVQQPQQNATTAAAQQQAQLIQQVLSLTPQQIDALAPEHRATILQIRQQALSNMTGR
ncbi:hypothetical protein Pst134EA_000164 [Puccinia striiformis f. sp. tritici]|uniref:RRM domain-containing protein n=1 Tax=Puccinia striiformis f. sp. tritici PST-78 TaxID=1165861 RepID=A0A0L0VC94_9BASI|nr:hypothetical protein Pst134EA_000164 [Puccinia striiformis f. sp. tritici]KAH9473083.1 hypothetical protein Pst134EA_000164 [Puccinia striiformis f. sp. tritici]KNE96599.1 hypothetical protein PSTG_10157 [Puccinia striiformis f. sp. tritici PST-78]